jgi:hypothetical protein
MPGRDGCAGRSCCRGLRRTCSSLGESMGKQGQLNQASDTAGKTTRYFRRRKTKVMHVPAAGLCTHAQGVYGHQPGIRTVSRVPDDMLCQLRIFALLTDAVNPRRRLSCVAIDEHDIHTCPHPFDRQDSNRTSKSQPASFGLFLLLPRPLSPFPSVKAVLCLLRAGTQH